MAPHLSKQMWINAAAVLLLAAAFVAVTLAAYTHLPVGEDVDLRRPGIWQLGMGVDWKTAYRPACLELLNGRSPYGVANFFNAPWILLPLMPVALAPAGLGSAIMFAMNLFGYVYVLAKLRATFLGIFLFLLVPLWGLTAYAGNIDGIVIVGMALPPPLGLFLLLAKPQVGAAVAAFWLIEGWRKGGGREVLRLFAPVLVAFLLSLALFGPWTLRSLWTGLRSARLDAGAWAWEASIGAVLLGLAVWKRDIRLAIASSPLLAPYLSKASYAVLWMGLLAVATGTLGIGGMLNRLLDRLHRPARS